MLSTIFFASMREFNAAGLILDGLTANLFLFRVGCVPFFIFPGPTIFKIYLDQFTDDGSISKCFSYNILLVSPSDKLL